MFFPHYSSDSKFFPNSKAHKENEEEVVNRSYRLWECKWRFFFSLKVKVSMQCNLLSWTWCVSSCSFNLKSDRSKRQVRKSEGIHVSSVSQRHLRTGGLHPALGLDLMGAGYLEMGLRRSCPC